MTIEVVPYSPDWPAQFADVAKTLHVALHGVDVLSIEHVGSTAVPGLAAKPILDIDVVVSRPSRHNAIHALRAAGYEHLGEQGIPDRHALRAPEHGPRRNVYVCIAGALALRNHLAVRDALRRSLELRLRYERVKLALAGRPGLSMQQYVAGKSAVLQDILAISDLTSEEKRAILEANIDPRVDRPFR